MKDSSPQWDSVSSDIVSKHDFFLLLFFSFLALNILSNPRRWREEKKRQISHSRGLYSSLLSRGSSRQRESLALLLFFFFNVTNRVVEEDVAINRPV